MGKNYKLKLQAKALVSECIKRNKMGDPHFMPLQETIEMRLNGLVGSTYWNQAKKYMVIYSAEKARKQQQQEKKKKKKQSQYHLARAAQQQLQQLQQRRVQPQAQTQTLP